MTVEQVDQDFLNAQDDNTKAVHDYFQSVLLEAEATPNRDLNCLTGNLISEEGCGYNQLYDFSVRANRKCANRVHKYISKHDVLLPRR